MPRVAILALVSVLACGSPGGAPSSAPKPPPPSASQGAPAVRSSPTLERGGARAAPDPPEAAKPSGPFNVVMISIDCLRADMPWAGYPRAIAPNLTALEKRAVSFTSGYSISSFTSKSIGGLLAGRYPSELARTGQFFTKYLPENKMFCESLAEQGVPCLGGHAHGYFFKGVAGFDQGFSDWRVVPNIAFDAQTDPNVTSQKLTPMAIEMLDNAKLGEKPFFAWFHYTDPHDRYIAHDESPKFGTKNRDIYDEEVFYTDLWIGKLVAHIEKQPWFSRTVLIVTADHGEAFGEHGYVRHGGELWEVLVHVPLFFLVPGQAPRHVATPRSHIDLARTIIDLVGAAPYAELRGESLKEELFGAAPPPRDVVCDLPQDDFNARHRSLLHDGWKLIAFGQDFRFELYNLRDDPEEKVDLFRREPDKAKEMVARYKETSKGIVDRAPR